MCIYNNKLLDFIDIFITSKQTKFYFKIFELVKLFFFLSWGPALTLNSWAQDILLPHPPQ